MVLDDLFMTKDCSGWLYPGHSFRPIAYAPCARGGTPARPYTRPALYRWWHARGRSSCALGRRPPRVAPSSISFRQPAADRAWRVARRGSTIHRRPHKASADALVRTRSPRSLCVCISHFVFHIACSTFRMPHSAMNRAELQWHSIHILFHPSVAASPSVHSAIPFRAHRLLYAIFMMCSVFKLEASSVRFVLYACIIRTATLRTS